MKIDQSTALVTGATGGLGIEFVRQLLERAATKVYASARETASLADVLALDADRRAGAIVNVLSMMSLAPIRAVATCAASKAALDSSTRSLRGDLGPRDIAAHAVYPALVDTRMAAGLDLPQAQAPDVITAFLDGVEAGDSSIVPDETSAGAYEMWLGDHRGLQAAMGAL
jgi:short-subunit dehydrogenase